MTTLPSPASCDDTADARRIGIILNPLSGRVRRNPGRFSELVSRIPAASIVQTSNPSEMGTALAAWALADNGVLVVIGGDGTLQAALTWLYRQQPEHIPQIMPIAAGTTNMSARAIGLRDNPLTTLEALVAWLEHSGPAPSCLPRPVLQVMDTSTLTLQCGMFFGAGAIVTGVRYFHSRVKPAGVKGIAGPALAFLRMLLALSTRTSGPLLQRVKARIDIGPVQREAPWLLLLATTLDKLMLGSKPFWGAERAAMHFTAIATPSSRLWYALPWVLRGRPTSAMRRDPDYLSHNANSVNIEHLQEYLLDGEIFEVSGKLQLGISADVRFIGL